MGQGKPGGVVFAGILQQFEILIAQIDERAPQGARKLRCSLTVPGIKSVVRSFGIMKISEELNDVLVAPTLIGDFETVFQHPFPMRNAVNTVEGQGESLLDQSDEFLRNHLCLREAGLPFPNKLAVP
jgi:hypothetical protein